MAETFGKSLRKARTRSGLLQRQLAEMVGISNSAVCRFEDDDKTPSTQTGYALVKALLQDALGQGVKVVGLRVTGEAVGDRCVYEVLCDRDSKPFSVLLEGREPLAKKGFLWRSKAEQIRTLTDVLQAMEALQKGAIQEGRV